MSRLEMSVRVVEEPPPRYKAQILRIGFLIDTPEGKMPQGFAFCWPRGKILEPFDVDENGVVYLCGWSLQELEQMVMRRSEFE